VQSPKQQQQQPQPPFRRPSGFDSAGARARIARRAALSPDDEASTTFSDGGSSSSFSASSRWDLEPVSVEDLHLLLLKSQSHIFLTFFHLVMQQPESRTDRGLLERCGKLLSSIQAFTGGDAAGSDQQPSPVSVLDAAAFLADGDSPSSSSGSKRAIDFSTTTSSVGRAGPKPASDPEDDEWALGTWPGGPEASGDPDYAYVAELVRLFGGARGGRLRDPADVYKAAEQRRRQRGGDPGDTWHQRRLLCGAVGRPWSGSARRAPGSPRRGSAAPSSWTTFGPRSGAPASPRRGRPGTRWRRRT